MAERWRIRQARETRERIRRPTGPGVRPRLSVVSLCDKDGGGPAGLIGGEAEVGHGSQSSLLYQGDELFWLPLVGRPLDRHPVVGLGALDIVVTDVGGNDQLTARAQSRSESG